MQSRLLYFGSFPQCRMYWPQSRQCWSKLTPQPREIGPSAGQGRDPLGWPCAAGTEPQAMVARYSARVGLAMLGENRCQPKLEAPGRPGRAPPSGSSPGGKGTPSTPSGRAATPVPVRRCISPLHSRRSCGLRLPLCTTIKRGCQGNRSQVIAPPKPFSTALAKRRSPSGFECGKSPDEQADKCYCPRRYTAAKAAPSGQP